MRPKVRTERQSQVDTENLLLRKLGSRGDMSLPGRRLWFREDVAGDAEVCPMLGSMPLTAAAPPGLGKTHHVKPHGSPAKRSHGSSSNG